MIAPPSSAFRLGYTILAENLGKGIYIQKCFGIIINIIFCMVYMAREVYGIYGRELRKSKQANNGQEFKMG